MRHGMSDDEIADRLYAQLGPEWQKTDELIGRAGVPVLRAQQMIKDASTRTDHPIGQVVRGRNIVRLIEG